MGAWSLIGNSDWRRIVDVLLVDYLVTKTGLTPQYAEAEFDLSPERTSINPKATPTER